MIYYRLGEKILFSKVKYDDLDLIGEDTAKDNEGKLYFLNKIDPYNSRRSFCVSDPSLLYLEEEGINLLQRSDMVKETVPRWIVDKIEAREVTSINTEYVNWKDLLNHSPPKRWRVNVFGLGDVGGSLVTGLRLMGGDCISEIGVYDRNENVKTRWILEANQILSTWDDSIYPKVKGINQGELFDCDMFVFCASIGVPPVGESVGDVRMAQFQGNSKLLRTYGRMAREEGFKGIFAVVSDPVDLLCKSLLIDSNRNKIGELDWRGLAPEQIRGYGLGVMHARAAYYAGLSPETSHYLREGRAYGPHGEGLIIADSIENYREDISQFLTKKAKEANLQVRSLGFKPYVAPALSSGTLSLIGTVKGKWHYSATYMGGVFMGSKNRLTSSGVEIERLVLPEPLLASLQETYGNLRGII